MTREWHELRESPMHRIRSALTRQPLPPQLASELASLSERIDYLALLVMELPDRELTPPQKERLRIIAAELRRRVNR